jgi:uncharacterized protein YndB with AHSA1/START domain
MADAKNSSAAAAAAQGATPFDLTLTRVFGAPRSLVFKAWTDPKHMAQWWGPRGFTNPVCEIDARVGGLIRIDMRGPDGTVYPMKGVFHEIVENERIVFTSTAHENAQGIPLIENLNTVTFAEFNGMTRMTLHVRVLRFSPEIAAALAGMEQGWSESLYRLAELADEMSRSTSSASADREMVISRVFDAPREMVWNAWTDPKQVVKWWGPHGFTTTVQEMDVRPGGVWRHTMHGPDGTNYPNKSVFSEVVRHERIVFSHGGGKEGGSEANFKSTWTFEEQEGKTRLTVRMVFDSAQERDRVERDFGAIEGGQQTLERLAEHLVRKFSSDSANG